MEYLGLVLGAQPTLWQRGDVRLVYDDHRESAVKGLDLLDLVVQAAVVDAVK